MRVIERRIDVELISRLALLALMQAKSPVPGRAISYSALADAASNHLRKAGIKRGVSKSTIGHLATGHIKSTNVDAAKAICAALDVPLGALFVTRVSTVQRDVPKGRAA